MFKMKEGFLPFLRRVTQDRVNRAVCSFNTDQAITGGRLQINTNGDGFVGIKHPGPRDEIYNVTIVRNGIPINVSGAPLSDEDMSEFNKFGKEHDIPVTPLHSGDPTQPSDKIMNVLYRRKI